jgi:hypothetical protein
MVWKRRGQQIVAQKMDNEAIVVDLRTGVYHSIGGSGTLIWDAIERGHSRPQILQLLGEAFESSPEVLNHELTQFIDQLVADDLIKPSEAAAADLPRNGNATEKRPFKAATVVKYRSSDDAFGNKAKSFSWQLSAPYVVSELVDDDVTVMNAQNGITCKMTGCGPLIWQSIEKELSVEQIVESIVAQFDTSADVAGREVDEFISKLASHALIQPKEAGAVPAAAKSASASAAAKKPFAPPAMAVDDNRHETLKRITSLHGWQITEPQIVSESIDDEVIVVDLQEGVYHSITGAGMVIWEGLTQGYSRDQVLDALRFRYEITLEKAGQELDDFVEKLAEFNLIRPRQSKPESVEIMAQPAEKEPFAPSVMTIYRDMESVLRLDPIHDFDEFGWPAKV